MAHAIQGHDARHLPGPFAVIGDVHGCVHTLDALLRELGGSLTDPVPGYTLVSVGDLHDKAGPARGPLRGEPGSTEVLRWALQESDAGRLITVDSNHGLALCKFLSGTRKVRENGSGAEATAAELLAVDDGGSLANAVLRYLQTRPVFVRLTSARGEFVVAHAAVSERVMSVSRLSERERAFHIRATDFRWHGQQTVVVGHMTVPSPTVTHEERPDGSLAGAVVRIDTGADVGGHLTAYLPNEHAFVTVPVDERDLAQSRSSAPDLVSAH